MEVDYLVVGAGAMGLAFTDVLMTESDATVAIVDSRDRPGGHWNDAAYGVVSNCRCRETAGLFV